VTVSHQTSIFACSGNFAIPYGRYGQEQCDINQANALSYAHSTAHAGIGTREEGHRHPDGESERASAREREDTAPRHRQRHT
jgi:hypothetical protein